MTAAQLLVVGTPIGNLGDLSPRAQQVLGEVGLIACEDTRRTGSLLAKMGIDNPGMVVVNEHTETRAVEAVIAALMVGKSVALVSDAGMPAISDPGARIVAAAASAGHEVVAVPGPTAVSSAIALSGFTATRWGFEGFLPRKGSDRSRHLALLAEETRMLVFYEAPHRIERTLEDLAGVLGRSRRCIVARELTKMHESVWRGLLGDAAVAASEPRGEYVIVVDQGEPPPPATDDDLAKAVASAQARGLSTRDAASEVATAFGVGRRRVYELANSSDR